MTEGVLVYLFRGQEILLAMKKRGFGEGKWNGPGGKMEPGETPRQAAIREVQEEIGVTPTLTSELGSLLYHDVKFGDWRVHIFRTEVWVGEPAESEEMKPQWWPVSAIPYSEMWSGDDVWTPYVVSSTPFLGEVWANGNGGVTKVKVDTSNLPASTIRCFDLQGREHEVERSDISWRPAAYGFVVRDGAVLLYTAAGSGTLSLPGGKIEIGEKAPDTIRRETLEEFGITVVAEEQLPSDDVYYFDERKQQAHHATVAYYRCRVISDAVIGQPEVTEPIWMQLNQLRPEDFHVSGRRAIQWFIEQTNV